jgi:hypothetical protein
MASSSLCLDDPDEGKILFDHEYTPDQSIKEYEGKTFKSYEEMRDNCPMLEARKDYADKLGIPYTPYTHRFVPKM